MKRKISIRVLCLVIALVVLGGTAAYAAISGSPYETLKDAIFDAVTMRNQTVAVHAELSLDGVVTEYQKYRSVIGDDSSLQYYYDENGEITDRSYNAEGFSLNDADYMQAGGTEWHSAYIKPPDGYYYFNTRGDMLGLLEQDERDSDTMRFVELLIDVLVGDLKNNITMVPRDGMRFVSGTLTESQIPELVKAWLAMMVEQNWGFYGEEEPRSREDYEYVLDIPITGIVIDYVHCEAEIDAEGNLLNVSGGASVSITNIFDETHIAEAAFGVQITDIGTSAPVCPITGAEQILTSENIMERFGIENRYTRVFFKLNPDGTIDEDSLTTTHPLEWEVNWSSKKTEAAAAVIGGAYGQTSVIVSPDDANAAKPDAENGD